MSAAELLLDLGRLGIRLEADGERLRYFPRSALTPDLLGRLKAHKGDLLAMLHKPDAAPPVAPESTMDDPHGLGIVHGERAAESAPKRFPHLAIPCERPKPVCRCGSTTSHDVPIHEGQSIRRDCGRCGRFLDFPVWYGKDAGHIGQYLIG